MILLKDIEMKYYGKFYEYCREYEKNKFSIFTGEECVRYISSNRLDSYEDALILVVNFNTNREYLIRYYGDDGFGEIEIHELKTINKENFDEEEIIEDNIKIEFDWYINGEEELNDKAFNIYQTISSNLFMSYATKSEYDKSLLNFFKYLINLLYRREDYFDDIGDLTDLSLIFSDMIDNNIFNF